MNELSKVVNAQLQQAAENLVRNRLMSDEFLDFVQENTKPLDTLMAYYKCAIMEVETKFKVLNEQFSLEYDRNPIESIKTRVKSLDGIVRKVRRKNIPPSALLRALKEVSPALSSFLFQGAPQKTKRRFPHRPQRPCRFPADCHTAKSLS